MDRRAFLGTGGRSPRRAARRRGPAGGEAGEDRLDFHRHLQTEDQNSNVSIVERHLRQSGRNPPSNCVTRKATLIGFAAMAEELATAGSP